jgi:hypothetical protein
MLANRQEDPLHVRMRRAAENQSLCREVNTRITELADRLAIATGPLDFICECANTTCTEKVSMTTAEYEEARRDPATFFVVPHDDHLDPEVEVVVARGENYWVVRKIGVGAEVAEARITLLRPA